MAAMIATPRLALLAPLIAAGLEVDRLRGRLRVLDRRLVAARRHVAGPTARTPVGEA